MYKLVTFAGYDNHGPHIFPIEPDVTRSLEHIKMARPLPPRIEQYIKTAKSIPGKTQLLIDAMGAGEFYGANVNADYFPEIALRHEGADYGYQTFMYYAYPFKHHVNKDPARAYGDKVTLADYDPHMHRVLLICTISDEKCRDILSDLANNRYWDVSMGCRVPWDECSICKNRAKNRGEYCIHLRYQMNKILQDGRRVCAYNWLPKFFDISFVTIGAEKASHVLKKVAMQGSAGAVSSVELGESYYAKLADEEKKAIQRKEADIDKDVPSQPPADVRGATPEDKAKIDDFMNDAGDVKADERGMSSETLNNLAGFPLDQVFSTLAALGISLRPEEFQRIILVKQGAIKLADQLERHHLVFDESERGPVPSWANGFGRYNDDAVNEKVAMYLRPYVADRSCYPEILLARLEILEKKADFEGYNRDSQWYPMSKDEKRRNSGIPGIIPASMALAAGFMVFKKAFPGLVMKGPAPVRALARNPWLLPMLIGAGVGASVGLSHMTAPRPLGQYGTGSGLDDKTASAYDAKTASVAGAAGRLGLIPAAYMYSGIQQRRWKRGERLNAIDRFFATRPDAAAIALFGIYPRLAKGAKNLVKKGGVMGDMALYAVGNSSKLMPAVLAGAVLDSAIFQAIQRIAARKKEINRAHSR